MVLKRDIINVMIFVVFIFLLLKVINNTYVKETASIEGGGGLVELTPTTSLLVTDSNGNLSTYNPAVDKFTTNDLTVATTDTHFKSNSDGTVSNKLTVNGDLTVKSGSINANGSINATGSIGANGSIVANGSIIAIGNISTKGALSAQNGLNVNTDATTATGTAFLKTSRNFLGNWPVSELGTDGVLNIKNRDGSNTHFGYVDSNNYIRGATTYITGNANIDGTMTVKNRDILSELNTLNAFMNKLTTNGFRIQNTENSNCLRNSNTAIFEGCSASNNYQTMMII